MSRIFEAMSKCLCTHISIQTTSSKLPHLYKLHVHVVIMLCIYTKLEAHLDPRSGDCPLAEVSCPFKLYGCTFVVSYHIFYNQYFMHVRYAYIYRVLLSKFVPWSLSKCIIDYPLIRSPCPSVSVHLYL